MKPMLHYFVGLLLVPSAALGLIVPSPKLTVKNRESVVRLNMQHRSGSCWQELDRRSVFLAAAAAGAAATTTFLSPSSPALAAADGGSAAFVGTYSDPVNHPGGTRTIRLLLGDSSKVGDYQLAEVSGGGGVGEPKSYVLPAVILGDRAIVIDFSPKGGPRDFIGVLVENGDIKFLRDGNKWPRIEK